MSWEHAKLLPVTLPDAERMSEALMQVSPQWRLRANLYPKLVKHAGESLTAEGLAMLFVEEVVVYTHGTDDLVGLVVKWLFRLLEDDTPAAAAAAVYIQLALANDDAILQEFADQTVSRLLGEEPLADDDAPADQTIADDTP